MTGLTNLKQICVDGNFNQAIIGVVWPAFLATLSVGGSFEQPTAGVVLLTSLQSVTRKGIRLQ